MYRQKILLVDESRTFQSLFSAALDQEGELLLASSGHEALVLIAHHYVDFICSGFYLPDMQGVDLCRRVRHMTQYAVKPFVLLTSVQGEAQLSSALPAGVTEIFHRSDINQLLAFIRRFPSARRQLKGKILYIEDSRSQRDFLKGYLETRGLNVDDCSSAEQAKQLYMQNDYDLILTDIVLDGAISGLALVNFVRRQTDNKGDIPIIAMTAFDDQVRRIELLNLGVTDYILKPIAQEELIVRIAVLLENRHLLLENKNQRQRLHDEELLRRDSKFESLFAHSIEGMVVGEWINDQGSDKDYRILKANAAFLHHVQLSQNQVCGKLTRDIAGWPFHELTGLFDQVVTEGIPRKIEFSVSGGSAVYQVRAFVLQELSFAFVIENITQRKIEEDELRIAAAAFESQEGIIVMDPKGVIQRVNRSFCRITGFTAHEVVGLTLEFMKSDRHAPLFYRRILRALHRRHMWQGEIWVRYKNAVHAPLVVEITAVQGKHGEVSHYLMLFHDISERKESEDKIYALAFFDQLTGLPNRILFQDRLQEAMLVGATQKTHTGLFLIDLDHFRTLNDTLGHGAGDQLLKQMAERLVACAGETHVVARLGGDEFIVMMPDLSPHAEEAGEQVRKQARVLQTVLSQPYVLDAQAHHFTSSMGVTLFKDVPTGIEALLKQAELAMYKAKAEGRHGISYFDDAMEVELNRRVAMEHALQQALQDGQFVLHYQAQLEAFQVIGVEALIRWQHPEWGLVGPATFIPLAEETGLIVPLGHWVMMTACQQLQQWSQDSRFKHLTVAVNVSARQFHQPDFVDSVLGLLQKFMIAPGRLKLELTESLLVHDVASVITTMTTLKQQGVNFSLDDFGTGYSSLSYLKRLPLHQLKIDQSFVRDIMVDANDAAIAKTIIALAQSLGLDVIAEGVETREQQEFLRQWGCYRCQGFYFSRALPQAEFESYAKTLMV